MSDLSEDLVVLDANVLYPMPLCDTLLSLAEDGMYLARWSGDVLEEVRRNLVADGRATAPQALRRIQLMNDAFPEANVAGYEALIPTLHNHEGDRHVLAAAIHARANYIVTQNLRHFPSASVDPFGIRVVTPDEFLLKTFNAESWQRDQVCDVIVRQSQSMRRPQLTPRAVLRALSATVPTFAKVVERHLEVTKEYLLDFRLPDKVDG